jgi:hypothetical protein
MSEFEVLTVVRRIMIAFELTPYSLVDGLKLLVVFRIEYRSSTFLRKFGTPPPNYRTPAFKVP